LANGNKEGPKSAEGLAMLRAMLAQKVPKETVQAVDMISA
jgi:hypothetical protein